MNKSLFYSSALCALSRSRALLSLLCTRFLFLLGGGGTFSRSLVCLSVTVFLGTGRQLLRCEDNDELCHTELLIFSSGARAYITRRHDGVTFTHIFTAVRRLVNIPGY